MHFLTTLLSTLPVVLAIPALALTSGQNTTLGHAVVENDCRFPVYLWSVASTVSSEVTLTPSTTYKERFHADAITGGVAIKITPFPDGLYTGAPLTIFAYSLVGEQVYYDLSDVFGDAFRGYRVSIEGPEGEGITWEDGVPPAGSQVRTQSAVFDLVLRLC